MMALIDVVPKPPASPQPLDLPPSSPVLPAHKQMLTLEHVQALSAPGNATKTEETPGDGQGAKTRASKLEFKTVNEM